MRKVRCVNGHDVTGVEGFICPTCRAEVQTVLRAGDEDASALSLRSLALVSGFVIALLATTLAVAPVGQDAFVGGLMISFAAMGAAMWVAACALIAAATVRNREQQVSSPE